MDRLDSVVGFDKWQSTYTPGVATSIVCNIGIRIGSEWIWKADGAGPSDMEADKGALSDAFKRAAVRWGVGPVFVRSQSAVDRTGKARSIDLYQGRRFPEVEPTA